MAYGSYIFDLYGTLADILTDEASPRLWKLSALYFGAHGAQYSAKELHAEYLRLCEREQSKSPDPLYEIELSDVFSELYCQRGVEPDGRLVAETALFFRMSSIKKLRLYPWVKPVFRRIREAGSGIYLLSNAQACFTCPELRALGIDGAFDDMLLSSDAGVKKPSPKIMQRLLRDNGLDPSDCLMTGNDQHADIAVAHAVGMDALYIRTATSGEYDPSLRAELELIDGDHSRLPVLLGLERE